MLRLGIVDFDSSHSIEFTRRFNHVGVDPDQCVDGARVVLGCPGTSEMSPERIPDFTAQIADCGVTVVDEAEQMIGQIDAVVVLSLSGSVHLERVRPFLEAGLPAYVDKPFACKQADAEEMVRLARKHGTVLFSTSALRFSEDIRRFRERSADYGKLHGVVSYGPAKRHPGNPGLFYYGIHPTEALFTLMGPGCRLVETLSNDAAEVATGHWQDGRFGTLRGNRQGSTAYGFVAFCEKAVVNQVVSSRYAYRNLCREIVRTFETGRPAVENEVTLEVVRFVLASLESEQRGGEPVALS